MKWLRFVVRVLLAAALLGGLAVFVALGPLRERTVDVARQGVERELSAALHAPVTIGALRVSFLPPRVEGDAIVLGVDGALARAGHVTVHLLPRTSLRQLRPVGEATVDDMVVAIPRWVALLKTPEPTPPTPFPPFRLRAVRITQASVRVSEGDEPFDVGADVVDGELEATPLGRLRFAADGERVRLARRGATLQLAHAHAAGGETANGWRLSAVEAVGDGVQLASDPPGPDRLPIRGRVALPRLAFASEVFERLGGDVEVDAALMGRLETPAAAGSVRVADLTFDSERIGDVDATAAWNEHRLTVSSARLAGFGGAAEASGTLTLSAPFTYGAQVHWSSLDVQQLARAAPQALKPSAANGQAELSGTLAPLTVRGEGTGAVVAAGGEPIDWHGRVSYGDGAGEGEVDATQARTNTLHARIAVGARRALGGALDVAIANPVGLGAFLPVDGVPNLTGSLTASAQVSGSTDDPRAAGDLRGHEVALLGVNFETLSGSFTLDRSALRTAGISARLWQGSLALSGTVALDAATENDWQVTAVDIPGDAVVAVVYGLTGSLPPVGRGVLAAQLRGHGPWPRAQVNGDITFGQFWLGREWIQRATVQGSATWPRWQLDGELRNRAGQTVALRGRGTAADEVALEAHCSGWDLTAVQRGELSETGGQVTLDAALSGPLRALSGRAGLQARGLALGGRRIGDAELDAVATRGRWQLTGTLLDGALTVRGGLAPDAGWPFTLDGEWTDAHLGHLVVPDADVYIESTGTLLASGLLGALQQLDATLRVQAVHIVHGPYELALVRPAMLACRRGACTFDAFELAGADTALRASGMFAAGGAVRVSLAGKGDLRLLELADGAIESARGGFTVDADVQRTGGRWEVSGQMTFDQAALDVGAPFALTRTSGRLSLDGTTVRVEQMAGRIGTGTFAVGGALDLTHGPHLTWTLTDVGADLLPSLEVELSGRGGLEGTWEHMRLAGEIDVSRLLYDRNIELTDFLPSLNRALAEAPRPPSARRVDLDLRVVAPGELYVENNIARIEARADLHITGTAEQPVLDGRVEALDGEVTFRQRTFELQGATVDFRPDLGLTAALNISAESTIDTPDATYTVGVRVTGTTADPRVALTSDDPGLTQTDIATLIAVGKTTAQLREGGGGFSMYDALSLVPRQLSEGVTESATELLPIDRISFEPTFSSTTGAFEPQLKLGKDLTDDLAVSVGHTFGVESRTTVEATYRLSQRVFLTGSWESQTSTQEGAFAGGVKLRYEFWRLTPFTLLGGLR